MKGQLTIHADRGSPMIAKPVVHLLADLGVIKSHSRPHASNDNPFSESQFRTLKYRPDFPDRFGSFEDAQAHCQRFMRINDEGHFLCLRSQRSKDSSRITLRREYNLANVSGLICSHNCEGGCLISSVFTHHVFVDPSPRTPPLPVGTFLCS